MSLRTACRLAGVPSSPNRRLISRRDRLVHNIPSRIGSPAVNSASSCRKWSSSGGCRSIAAWRPAPFFSDAARRGIARLFQFHPAPPYGFRVDSEQPGDILDATMAQLGRLDPRIAPPILLRQRRKQPLHLHLYRFLVTVQSRSSSLWATVFIISHQSPVRRCKSGSCFRPHP